MITFDELDFILYVFFMPALYSFVIVSAWLWLVAGKGSDSRKLLGKPGFFKFIFTLHPDKGLMQQGLLWLSIFTPFTYFLEFSSYAWEGYTLQLDAVGFKKFTEISALPLAILSLALPLSILVARFHGSQQTAEQIKNTRQKNNIDLFHSHRKEMFSYFTQVGDVEYLGRLKAKNNVHPRVHKGFFVGKPVDGTPVPNIVAFIQVSHELKRLIFLLNSIIRNEDSELSWSRYTIDFCPSTYKLALCLGLAEIIDLTKRSLQTNPIDGRRYRTLGLTTEESVASIRYLFEFYNNLCDFAGVENETFLIEDKYHYILSGDSFEFGKKKIIEQITGLIEFELRAKIEHKNHKM